MGFLLGEDAEIAAYESSHAARVQTVV
jgi:hypothetical protein